MCFSSIASQAQSQIRFRNITVNDGLSMGTITGVQQDNLGFIWIATAEGLHRFDGTRLKVFKHRDNDANSLSDSYVRCILAVNSKLYIGNNVGNIDILNLNDYSIETINLSDIDSTYDFPVTNLEQYNDQLIVGTAGGGIWKVNLTNNKLSKIDIVSPIEGSVNDIEVIGDKYYVITNRYIYEGTKHHLKAVFHTTAVSFNCIGKYNNLFLLGAKRGLYSTADFSDINKIELPKGERLIYSIQDIVATEDKAWIATEGGLLLAQGSGISHYKANMIRPYSLVHDKVYNLFIDRSNNLWVGTISGLSWYSPDLKKFNLLQYFDWQGKSYNSNVYCLFEDSKKTIWAGTLTSGLIKLNSDRQIEKVYPLIKDGKIETKFVRSIFEDADGDFWIGTRDEGLFHFNPETEKFTHIANAANGKLKTNVVLNVFQDKEGQLWVGSTSGLYQFDKSTEEFTHYVADTKIKSNNVTYQIEELANSNKLIIASFRGGIQIFDKDTKSFTSHKHNASDSTTISNNNVMSLAWINEDTLLIGTYSGGLNILDLRTMKFTHITEGDGLINNVVYGIVYNGSGNCWLSTNNGVVNYNIYEKKFTNFGVVHYLQSSEFNEGAFVKSMTGEIFFGGVNGINYFKPEELNYTTSPPNLLITDMRGDYLKEASNSLAMDYLKSRLEVDFKALDYSNPEGVKYRYKLEGYEDNWIESNNYQSAVYPRLGAGKYTFYAEATDEFGKWTSKLSPLSIYVKPPFWQRWWFIALVILTCLLIIYLFLQYRTREIERSYKLQLIDSELAALRSQMNPHFIFNSLNSIQYFILKKEPKEAYTYLSKFASLMRKILQNSRLKYISIADEVEWLDLYLEMEKMRMDNTLDFSISTHNINELEGTYMPTMLIQPFVENSIVHGLLPKEGPRKLHVSITRKVDTLICEITDNGIGRKASQELNKKRTAKHNSAGMSLTRKRLEILSEGQGDYGVSIKDLIEGDQALGTQIELVIPVIKQID